MKRYIFILTIFAFFSVYLCQAQNTGFGGKRVLLKTDIVNGARSPLFNASAELILTRHITLSGGFRFTKGQYNQIYFPGEYETSDYDRENKLKDKAEISSKTLMLEGRIYFSGVVPAPRGSFFYGAFNYNKLNVAGNYYHSLLEKTGSGYSSSTPDMYFSYEANDILAIGVEAGYGYQTFLNKFLTLGFKIGVNKTFFNADGKYEPAVLSGVAKTYGPNLLRLAPIDGLSDITPVSADSEDNTDINYYKGSFGLAFYVQFGILLF